MAPALELPTVSSQLPPSAASSSGAPTPTASPRGVASGRGVDWWTEAWRLFAPAAGTWIVILIVLFILNLVLAFVPVLGHIAGQLLLPVFSGGLMLGCRAIDRGERLTIEHLFAGFGARFGPLLIVGAIYLGAIIAIMLVVFGLTMVFFGATIVGSLWHLRSVADPLAIGSMLGGFLSAVLVASLIFLLLYLPLLMAVWFAPALIVLRGVEPLQAMRLSFDGCLRNVVPFLIYGLIGLLLAIVASIPLMLGWLVLGPVTIASVYAGYCDIYEDQPVRPPA